MKTGAARIATLNTIIHDFRNHHTLEFFQRFDFLHQTQAVITRLPTRHGRRRRGIQ